MKTNGTRSDRKEPEVIEGETGKVAPTPGAFGKDGRRIDLSSLRDVRLEMVRIYRMQDAELIDSGEMNKRIWALGEIGKIITIAELEKRLGELEARNQLQQPGRALPAPSQAIQ